ncbi:MAG: DNA-directed RNA polymerase subunit beta [Nitrospinota bacterium]|jgi:DNA-directed RNA polymerase subunit beta|nr:DNA-directed RNA polymerase subunit beta [Nitrospinota bacterium]
MAKETSRNNGQDGRISFGTNLAVVDIPNLIEIQLESYERFMQSKVSPSERENEGLENVFQSVFPVSDYNGTAFLNYVGYEVGSWTSKTGEFKGLGGPGVVDAKSQEPLAYRPKNDMDECRERGMSYSDPLRVIVQLVLTEKGLDDEPVVKDIKEQKVYLGEIPLMTENGTFIINGTERVVVSQMHRSPGVFFSQDSGPIHSGKHLFSARVIPYRGSWLDFEVDSKDILYVRIDRRRKLPATTLLRALGLDTEEIVAAFYSQDEISVDPKSGGFKKKVSELIVGQRATEDLVDLKSGDPLTKVGRKITRKAYERMEALKISSVEMDAEVLLERAVARAIVNEGTGEVILEAGAPITPDVLEAVAEAKVRKFHIIHQAEAGFDSTILDTLKVDKVDTPEDALLEIYKRLRPGDPPTRETARALFDNLFLNSKRYDLSRIGRMKINSKLALSLPLGQRTLTQEDVVKTMVYLVGLRSAQGTVDDIDHLGNRRVRSVGELLENQFRIGLVRMERAIRERMSIIDLESAMPQDLINAKPIAAAIKEFFGSAQLSQFMDQTNPLSELTHKRRLSALGPGGLTRERAGFEVRDVHQTHYGRICPIETPEGPNIGLISSLSTYARVSEFGFIETPYRKVQNGRVSDKVEFLTAIDEDKCTIAQANAPINKGGKFVNDLVSCRTGGEFVMASPDEVNYMDVSPKQLVSVATSLIPFLENDDANRALMGSNMQRQAVPLLRPEAPFVGTGMEGVAATNSGAVIVARTDGEVVDVEASRIVVRTQDRRKKGSAQGPGVNIYNLTKYRRSNQNTCFNQRPIVKLGQKIKKGQVLADGPAIEWGELALGRNVLVAFMPWRGYNFEDAIVISEKVVKEDIYTSIHIEEFEVEARDTKLGKEDVTRDIPNVGEEVLKDLDESGVVRIGAKVGAGSILVGKVTPKGETQLSPEEKLLKAIFGEKAGDVRDTSLTVPPGVEGTVVYVKVFSRRGVDKDVRAVAIEEDGVAKIEKDYQDEIRILEEERDGRIRPLIANRQVVSRVVDPRTGKTLLSKGAAVDPELLEGLPVRTFDALKDGMPGEVRTQVAEIDAAVKDKIGLIQNMMEEKIAKLRKGNELPPGVIKLVKVFVAVKRKLQVGDKMAGRHGNKGVVSIIVPEEDMPYMPDGRPIEIILNPLGVPSRMNVGQVLETHLGWAAKVLGVNFATPVFEGAKEKDIRKALKDAGLPESGETLLYDGRTGAPFDQKVAVGYIYMLKLHHLVDEKIHARSTGPYSLVTQQPLGGKAQFGGQRLGEMEVWALEAYGAARILQEMLTVKSDDIAGRTRMYESIVKGESALEASLPESFNVMMKELQALALDVELIEETKTAPTDGPVTDGTGSNGVGTEG